MRILILGAGVVGTTTAWELAQDGHEVVVLDRAPRPAQGASFGNAGLIATGDALAWASPDRLKQLPLVWLGQDPAMKIGPLTPELIQWGLRFLPQCTHASWWRNSQNKHQLCVYSQQRLRQLREETPLDYHRGTRGVLYLYRDSRNLEHALEERAPLTQGGQELRLLTPDEIYALDPGYADSRAHLAGAVYSPTDESGDSHVFTQALAKKCQERGVTFHFNCPVERLDVSGDQVNGVLTRQGTLRADRYVLALGAWSPHLLRPLGIDLPIYPVQGVSATVPIAPEHTPPELGGIDEDARVAFSTLGNKLRLTTLAAFQGYRLAAPRQQLQRALAAMQDLFPRAADYTRPQFWSGLRPMTPEGTPIIGAGPHRNLLYNTGHGHLGWTMACGSARLAADLLQGRSPELDPQPYRFR